MVDVFIYFDFCVMRPLYQQDGIGTEFGFVGWRYDTFSGA
jgi:hypothetical protein